MDLNKLIIQTQGLLIRTIPKMIDIHLDLSDDIEQINADPDAGRTNSHEFGG